MTFSRYGSMTNWNGFPERTYLFKDIRDKDGNVLTDHLWIKNGKRVAAFGELKEGDVIQKIDRWYEHETDYTLKFPTNFRKL